MLEVIPGEDDELAPEHLPELPEGAEEVSEHRQPRRRRRSRKGRGERGAGAPAPREEEDDLEPVPRSAVPNKILVNAADREEKRVAVVRGRAASSTSR